MVEGDDLVAKVPEAEMAEAMVEDMEMRRRRLLMETVWWSRQKRRLRQ